MTSGTASIDAQVISLSWAALSGQARLLALSSGGGRVDGIDALVIGGGAALFLQPELEVHFNYPPCRGKDDYTGRWAFSNQRRGSTKLHWWTNLPTIAHDTTDKDSILSQFWQDGRSIDVRGLFTLLTEAD